MPLVPACPDWALQIITRFLLRPLGEVLCFKLLSLMDFFAFQVRVEVVQELAPGLVPDRRDENIIRRRGEQTLEHDVRREEFEEIGNQRDIFLIAQRGKRLGLIQVRKSRVPDDLKLVKFQEPERKPRELVRHGKHVIARLRRKTEDQVRPDFDAPSSGHGQGTLEAVVIMPPVDERQGPVMDGLEPVLHKDKTVHRQLFEKGDLLFVHAVRTGPDGKPDNAGLLKRLTVQPLQRSNRRIGVREWLEVDDELLGAIPTPEVGYPLFDLVAHGSRADAVAGPEAVIIAVDTAAYRHRAVSVRAGESRIHIHFVYGLTEEVLHVLSEGVVPPGGPVSG